MMTGDNGDEFQCTGMLPVSPIHFSEDSILSRFPHGAIRFAEVVTHDPFHSPMAAIRVFGRENHRTPGVSRTH